MSDNENTQDEESNQEENKFSLKKRKKVDPPLMIIYGPAGVGKTTLPFTAEGVVYLQTEDGGGEMELPVLKDGVFTSYEELIEALAFIYRQGVSEGIKTIVIDSLDHLEPLVWDYVCRKNNWESIEQPGYGKGYIECDAAWRKLIGALLKIRDNKSIAVVAIAHDLVRTVNDPMADPYDAHELKLHKRAVGLWKEKSDMIALLKNPVVTDKDSKRGKGGTTPTLFTRPNAAYTAKTRYTKMPNMISIPLDGGWDKVIQYIPYYNQS